MYVNIYRLAQFILDLHTHVCMHAHACTCTPARKSHPSHMLTSLLPQNGETALWLACAYKQEAAAAELMEATKLAGALDLQVGHEA